MKALSRQAAAEFAGTAMLLCAVIGSGMMAERLAGGNTAIALLANTLATVFALFVLIEVLGPVSGAHFNPLVTLALAVRERVDTAGAAASATAALRRRVAVYWAAQTGGAVTGAVLTHAMFSAPLLQVSSRARDGAGLWLAEAMATACLLFVVMRAPPSRAAALVAATIGAAYWFTSSTSFANPAAVLGRMFSDSFAGIAPASAPGFVLAQGVGAALGAWLAGWLPSDGTSEPRHTRGE